MAKKIKKRSNQSPEVEDPNLEDIGDERGFEVELDEETNEIVFVMHYRRRFGDGFDADTEHALNITDATELVGMMMGMIEAVKMKILVEKSTMAPIEGNPLQGPRIADKGEGIV